jgi:hypothetical protein
MESRPGIATKADSDARKPEPGREVPLCVDLDGTLAKTDLLLETIVSAINTLDPPLPDPRLVFFRKSRRQEQVSNHRFHRSLHDPL